MPEEEGVYLCLLRDLLNNGRNMSQFSVFQQNTKRESGKKAQHGNISAAKVSQSFDKLTSDGYSVEVPTQSTCRLCQRSFDPLLDLDQCSRCYWIPMAVRIPSQAVHHLNFGSPVVLIISVRRYRANERWKCYSPRDRCFASSSQGSLAVWLNLLRFSAIACACHDPMPILQSIIELSRTQDEEVGDGTTSVIILGACAL